MTGIEDITVKQRLTRRLWGALATLTMSALLAVATATPANAWTRGNVWVNFGSWNCSSGGVVRGIHWAVDAYSSGPAQGDWGDNVIYPTVRVGPGSHNTLSYQLYCTKWGWYTYRSTVGYRYLTPSRSGVSYTF